MLQKSSYIILFILISAQLFGQKQESFFWLDTLKMGEVIEQFGPPQRMKSFGLNPLNISGYKYEHGIGTHAPSNLRIQLDGKAIRFHAYVGIDNEIKDFSDPKKRNTIKTYADYVHGIDGDKYFDALNFNQGGTANFIVMVDGNPVFESGDMSVSSQPMEVDIDLSNAREMTLIVNSWDGYNVDHADWAMAKIFIAKDASWNHFEIKGKGLSNLLINHLGYLPYQAKYVVGAGKTEKAVYLKEVNTDKICFETKMSPVNGDFGLYTKADFTSFSKPGRYYLESENMRSSYFDIKENVYDVAINKILNYYPLQRCGSEKGWHGACHLDDGIRSDNKQHQDVSGGWHDACDVRKWDYTIINLAVFSKMINSTNDILVQQRILDEIKWGNKYFQAMQDPSGFMMSYCGGKIKDNHWTDNISGNADDREITVEPSSMIFQYMFLLSQAKIAQIFKNVDSVYAEKASNAAKKSYQWCSSQKKMYNPDELGVAICSSLEMFRLFKDDKYLNQAIQFSNDLLCLQDTVSEGVKGFFRKSKKDNTPMIDFMEGCWSLIGLCDLALSQPVHPDYKKWKRSIQLFSEAYFLEVSNRSAFGIVPIGLYNYRPGSDRKIGKYYYRWFYENYDYQKWWNGINPTLGCAGVGLCMAGRILKNQDLVKLAQRQLDWIIGLNPYNASTFTGIGMNQPALFKSGEFKPITPELIGGGMAGIGGSTEDVPVILPGYWNTCEYWSPATVYTLWLMIELTNNK